ncbi:hypothetical protein HBH98_070970 [Parastagonospora nodorum]|nr:hypothetical protein HBI10_106340 [Parastagonospora nodorum]KAH4009959.1 hypothetical protein HBI13_212320 [Parastagonospora nodorum]KAH4207059.1 hypothetical protein HBI95_111810 [Parastagonospora nodorum]KAH4239775.1 hypothetical protein HBI06_029450 [Parastagonospora nodorum]KAH4244663.1 hypothetical protein HBI05_073900 [Parastagonospora nodorum]
MRLPFLLPLLRPLVALVGLALGALEANSTAPRSSIDGVPPVLDIAESYIRSQTDGSAIAIGYNGMANCSSRNPCILGSCCNSDGQCGYRPEHCSPSSPKTCVANCDAKAPCGKYSADGKTSCPLNVCCSSSGFCGTSDVFCHDSAGGAKASENVAAGAPSCGKNSNTASRRIAYYQSWNSRSRGCDKVMPNQLNLSGITHLVLAFATIDPVTYKIGLRDTADDDVYREFLSLPDSVSKWIGIGGFQFTDSDQPTHQTFSKMSSSKENRKAFTDSLQQFLSTYKFSGVDIDWEWPGNSDRGGDSGDKANQVELLQDMRQALGNNIGLGVAIPAQYTYLQNIDLKGLEAQVDWLSILTYDLHGAWDATTPGLGPKIRPHTDLQEVDTALNLLWGTQIDSRKINMGIANYGRGYTVEKKECAYFGCTYTGPSKAGSCTLQEGILSSCEIRRLISEKHLSWKVIQGGAEVNEVTWDDQWIAWDDTNTLGKKLELANDRCLGGTALWAIDYDVCPTDGGSPQPGTPGSSAVPSQPASSQIASSQPSVSVSSDTPLTSSQSQGSASSDSPPVSTQLPPSDAPPTSSQPPGSASSDSPPASTQPSWSAPSDSRPASQPASSQPSGSAPSSAPPASSEAPSSAPPSTQLASSDAPSPPASSAQGSSQAGTSSPPASGLPAPSGSPPASSQEPSSTAQVSSAQGSSMAASSVVPSSQASSNTWSPPASSSASSSSVASAPPASSEQSSSEGSSSSNAWTASSEASSSSNAGTVPVPVPTDSWTSSQVTTTGQPTTQSGSSWGWSSGSAPLASSGATSGESGVASSDMHSWAPSLSGDSSSGVAATTDSVSQPGSSSSAPGATWSHGSASSGTESSAWASSTLAQVSSGATASSNVQTSAWDSSTPVQVTSGAQSSAWGSGTPIQVTSGATASSTAQSSAWDSSTPVQATSGAQSSAWDSGTPIQVTSGATAPSNAQSSAWDSGTPIQISTGAVTTSAVPVPDRKKCPKDCYDLPWCQIFCNDLDFIWPPPLECWFFDWCRLWWGLSDKKIEEDKDGKKCKLLGCGCGWMGLPWGPGCPSPDFPFPINIFINIFGLFPDPCLFWGCGDKCGLLGCFGYCFGEEGCIECPKVMCPHGGPEPGPIPKEKILPNPPVPTEPGKGPKKCGTEDFKTATDKFVFCKESVDLSSAISATTVSTWASTAVITSSSSYSSCQTPLEVTISGCYVVDIASTTTTKVTESNTISTNSTSSEAPACTRAPLSLDDDEGNNIPVDWDSSSSRFGGNTTDFASNTSMASTRSDPSWTTSANFSSETTMSWFPPNSTTDASSTTIGSSTTDPSGHTTTSSGIKWGTSAESSPSAAVSSAASSSEIKWGTSTELSSSAAVSSAASSSEIKWGTSTESSSSAAASSTASTTPSPAPGPMDKNGVWRFAIQLWMQKNQAKMEWVIYDPNGFHAGSGNMFPAEGDNTIFSYMKTNHDRPFEHQMPYGVDAFFYSPTAVEDARVSLKIKKSVPNCSKSGEADCFPKVTTENRSETKMFEVESCWQYCDKDKPELILVKPSDLNCDDMNDADWVHNDNAWSRNFNCYLKGF